MGYSTWDTVPLLQDILQGNLRGVPHPVQEGILRGILQGDSMICCAKYSSGCLWGIL